MPLPPPPPGPLPPPPPDGQSLALSAAMITGGSSVGSGGGSSNPSGNGSWNSGGNPGSASPNPGSASPNPGSASPNPGSGSPGSGSPGSGSPSAGSSWSDSGSSGSSRYVVAFFMYYDEKILDGVDPTEVPFWACVRSNSDSNSDNTAFHLVIDPPSLAKKIKIVALNPGMADISQKDGFNAAKTPLTISGKDQVGDATFEVRNKSNGKLLDTLKVKVLPYRTLQTAIYKVSDSSVPCTADFTKPTDASLMEMLKLFEKQGCVGFTNNLSSSININYDSNANCALNNNEVYALSDYTSYQYQIRALWVKNSAMTADAPCETTLALGLATSSGDSNTKCLGIMSVDTANSVGQSPTQGMAHEFGHLMGLDHDDETTPPNILPLMRSGINYSTCERQPIGYWLRHESWQTINDTVAGWLNPPT